MGPCRPSALDLLAVVGVPPPDLSGAEHLVLSDRHLHSTDDSICPRCLQWIEERHFVRRTAFGPLQHEVCPRG